jgi:hypothetical protein
MVKVYSKMSVKDNYTLDELRRAKFMEIKSADTRENSFFDQNGLFLKLQKYYPRGKCHLTVYYGLIGNELIDKFMNGMKVGKTEELVGKIILGIVNKDKPALDGVCAYD